MRSWDRYVYLLVESVLRKGTKEEIIRGRDSNMRLVFVGKGVYLEINTDLSINLDHGLSNIPRRRRGRVV